MKPTYRFFFSTFFLFVFALLEASAQTLPGDYRVPVLRLTETSRSVHAQNYAASLAETTVNFTGTALMPKAHGTAKVEVTREGLKVQVHAEALDQATQIDPANLTYVLWAVPASPKKAQNLGELVRKGEESTVTGVTNLTSFALIVTAEPYFAVKQPSAFIVLQNAMPKRTEDPDIIRADLLSLRGDPKTPLDIYEARNAVRIARLAGAELFAAEPFHKALRLLQQAESIFAHKKGQDIPDAKEKAREATEAAEDARAAAAEHAQESRPFPRAEPANAADAP